MFKNLKLLLSARAWLKSRTLNVAGILGAIATMDLTAGTGVIQTVLETVQNTLHVMPATAIALLTAVKATSDAVLRVKTDRSVAAKVVEPAKDEAPK